MAEFGKHCRKCRNVAKMQNYCKNCIVVAKVAEEWQKYRVIAETQIIAKIQNYCKFTENCKICRDMA